MMSCCDGFGIEFGDEAAIWHFLLMACHWSAGPVACTLGQAGAGEVHELIEHGELEFELDGVDHRLHRCFADVIVGVLEPYEDDVHAQTDGVDDNELDHDFPGVGMVDGSQ